MDAEKKTERPIEKKTGENSGDGNQPETNDYVKQLDDKIQRLETAAEKAEAIQRSLTQLMAKQALGGSSLITQPEIKKEPTDREFKEKFMKGELENPFR